MTEEFTFGKASIVIQGPNGKHIELDSMKDAEIFETQFGEDPQPGVLIHKVKVFADADDIIAYLYADLGFYELHLADMEAVAKMKPPFRIHLQTKGGGSDAQ